LFHFVGACQLTDVDYNSSLSAEQMQPTVRTSKRDLFPMDAQLHTQEGDEQTESMTPRNHTTGI
jgi:hypothetical protein